jgi:microcystin-dependent protein
MDEPLVGEIRLVPYNFEPQGWAFCDGRMLEISPHTALFSLLGTTFGGDGERTFGLPDLRGRVPIGAGESASGSAYVLGETGGSETARLTTSHLPVHSHAIRASSNGATTNDPSNGVPAAGGAYAATSNATMSAAMSGNSGGGSAHENRQPYMALNYIIALQGAFPSPA